MKIYKFRSLIDCTSLERVLDTLDTGKFWCSRFWELNDPMEGIYSIRAAPDYRTLIERISEKKYKKMICSFSGEEAKTNPLMWGYYCNGFKGIALEIEVLDRVKEFAKNMDYCNDLVEFNGDISVDTILRRKLSCWKHEQEVRFLFASEERMHCIGEIVSVIIGRPYQNALKHPDKDGRHAAVNDYERRVRAVINVAEKKGISIKEAKFIRGKIKIEPKQK